MPALTYTTRKRKSVDLLFIGVPFLIIFILCFMDEGYYDFRWMQEPGNWVVFALYWMAMVFAEFLVSLFLPRSWSTTRKMCIICGVGIPLGFVLILGFLTFVTGFSV